MYRLGKTRRGIRKEEPVVEKILFETKGLILYQDQIMQLGELVAGLSPKVAMGMVAAIKSAAEDRVMEFRDMFIWGD